MKRFQTVLVAVMVAAGLFVSMACEWDYDTLKMERMRFPSALELVTGKFLRHSPEFYEWRIKNRAMRITDDPNDLALYDDLAVAYDKTDQQDKAIEIILQKDKLSPGLYETEANLGTFLIHSGKLEEGVQHLNKAIEINPDAHFGREIYQVLLVEYVIQQREDKSLTLPLNSGDVFDDNFDEFVHKRRGLEKQSADTKPAQQEIQRALKGVLGMMRFGNYRSPVLLEAAGDLLSAGYNHDAKRLAARAYLKAAMEVEDADAKQAYRKMAEEALSMQTRKPRTSTELTLSELEATFAQELREADRWYQQVADDERRWINEGIDVDQAFSAKYYQEPSIGAEASASRPSKLWLIMVVTAAMAGVVMLYLVDRWRRYAGQPGKSSIESTF